MTTREKVIRAKLGLLGLLISGVVLIGSAQAADAQVVRGVLLDEISRRSIANARVLLEDREGRVVSETHSDAEGRFELRAPLAGEYYLVAERIGYRATRSSLIALGGETVGAIEFFMRPAPVGLEALDVEVDVVTRAEDELRIAGIDPRNLKERFVTPEEIAAVEFKRDIGSLLEWQSIGGLQVTRTENINPEFQDMGLCISLARGTSYTGQRQCALLILNGVPLSTAAAQHLDPEQIEAMAVLLPSEAATIYGTIGGGGVVMMWTKQRR